MNCLLSFCVNNNCLTKSVTFSKYKEMNNSRFEPIEAINRVAAYMIASHKQCKWGIDLFMKKEKENEI